MRSLIGRAEPRILNPGKARLFTLALPLNPRRTHG
jgi:hypothetical protein